MKNRESRNIVEALLFSTSEVMGGKLIAQTVGSHNQDQLKNLVNELNREYKSSNRAFRIQRIGDGYQMRTLPKYRRWIQKTIPKTSSPHLTQSQLLILATVSCHQPITRAEIDEKLGGVTSDGVWRTIDRSYNLRKLLEKRLIRILRRDKNRLGRPIIYGISRQFLSLFNLEDLRDLPKPPEIDPAIQDKPIPVFRNAG